MIFKYHTIEMSLLKYLWTPKPGKMKVLGPKNMGEITPKNEGDMTQRTFLLKNSHFYRIPAPGHEPWVRVLVLEAHLPQQGRFGGAWEFEVFTDCM